MIRKPLKTNLQSLIYSLHWNRKVIKKLKNELALSKDNDEIYARKTHGLNFIRLLVRRKNINNKIAICKSTRTCNT